MATLNFVEKIVKAFVANDNKLVLILLREEAEKMKKDNRKKAYMEITNLIKGIPLDSHDVAAASPNNESEGKDSYFISNSSNKLVTEYYSKILPEEVILNENSKKIIKEFFREWESIDTLKKHNLSPVNKILLYGKPGTGKTYLAHAIANQLDLPLTIVKLDELVSSYLGNTGKNLRDIFKIAREKKTILFLDEFDTIGKFRSDSKELGELKRIVTVLLQNIDNFPDQSILIAATNHEEILDKALWRRFPLKVEMELPDQKSIIKMLNKYLDKHEVEYDVEKIVQILFGLSGSDIKNLCDFVVRDKILSGKEKITSVDIAVKYLILNLYQDKKEKYAACKLLSINGLKIKEIAEISNIPYTTLIDNIN